MSIKLPLAATSRDTERGLSSTPGTGIPRVEVTPPSRNRTTSTAKNEDVGDMEKDEDAVKAERAGKAKPKGGAK